VLLLQNGINDRAEWVIAVLSIIGKSSRRRRGRFSRRWRFNMVFDRRRGWTVVDRGGRGRRDGS
jgi:hypothetical protein